MERSLTATVNTPFAIFSEETDGKHIIHDLPQGYIVELVDTTVYLKEASPCYLCWIDSKSQGLIPISHLDIDKDSWLHAKEVELRIKNIQSVFPVLISRLPGYWTLDDDIDERLRATELIIDKIIDRIYDM